MNKGKIVLIVVAILVCVIIGFVAGQVVQAMNTLPGSSDDPVATESYVETTIGERLATLSTQVDELEAEVAALKGEAPRTSANKPTTSDTDNTGDTGSTGNSSLTITGNNVRLRSAASTNGDVIGSLSKGTTVTKLGEEGDWYKVEANGKTGYVSSQFAQ